MGQINQLYRMNLKIYLYGQIGQHEQTILTAGHPRF
jgi:hypothetical protein